MYFVQLINLSGYNKSFLKRFDKVLKSLHSSTQNFTPELITRELEIDIETSFQLLFEAREIGIVHNIKGKICEECRKVYFKEQLLECKKCESNQFKYGYYFTTESCSY